MSRGIAGKYKLIVASNRDENLDRPTEPIHFWKDSRSHLLAGRDAVAGGTWLGVNRCGKFGTVTNIPSVWAEILNQARSRVRPLTLASSTTVVGAAAAMAAFQRRQDGGGDGGQGWTVSSLGLLCAGLLTSSLGILVAVTSAARRSRGMLVANFLRSGEDAQQYCARLSKECWRYAGFNLVLTDPSGAWVLSNKGAATVTRLPHGFYGVSNAALDKPWPKMLHGKSRVLEVLAHMSANPKLTEDALVDLLMDVLADETPCPPWEEKHSWWWPPVCDPAQARVCVTPTTLPSFLGKIWPWTSGTPPATTPNAAYTTAAATRYGTRSSTVVLMDASGRMKVVERNLGQDEDGKMGSMRDASQNQFEFCDV